LPDGILKRLNTEVVRILKEQATAELLRRSATNPRRPAPSSNAVSLPTLLYGNPLQTRFISSEFEAARPSCGITYRDSATNRKCEMQLRAIS
jgi:hypothetical protein